MKNDSFKHSQHIPVIGLKPGALASIFQVIFFSSLVTFVRALEVPYAYVVSIMTFRMFQGSICSFKYFCLNYC